MKEPLKICHDVKKFVLASKVCHDIKKLVMTSKIDIKWRQKVCHNFKNMSKLCRDVKNIPWCLLWCQKYVMTSKSLSRHQKVPHEIKNTSWRHIKDRHDVKKCVMTSKTLPWHKTSPDVKNTSKNSSQLKFRKAAQKSPLTAGVTIELIDDQSCLWAVAHYSQVRTTSPFQWVWSLSVSRNTLSMSRIWSFVHLPVKGWWHFVFFVRTCSIYG